MTQKVHPAETPVAESKSADKAHFNIEEIVDALNGVGDDVEQIAKLTSQEQLLVAQFLEALKQMPPLISSVEVSTSMLPIGVGAATQAHLTSTGHLLLTFEDGNHTLIDLSETKNRDLLMATVDDLIPKFKDLATQMATEKLQKPKQVQEPPQIQEAPTPQPPAPEPLPEITLEAPAVESPTLAPTEVPEETLPQEVMPEEVPVLSVENNDAKIEEITAMTLGYLEMLGSEVFERSPVSMYFDDWMVNLRQIILSFESHELISPDEIFTNEYNRIFTNIEEELTKRLAADAEIEVSAKTLVENRYLLNKIDEGYATQTKNLVVKGKSNIEYLTRNVHKLEAELAEVAQIKVSFRHPLQKLSKDQKISELTQKLNAAKKQLALAVGTSSVDQGKTGDIDAEYAAQTQELTEKRNSALDILSKEVQELEAEIAKLEKIQTSNPIKMTATAQKRFDTTQKLIAAKTRLELAEQNSNAEQEKLKAEYEKKKQATLGKMQTLEKDIATKAIDTSTEVRKEAANALANAVKALIQRQKIPPQTDNPQSPN